MSDPTHNGRPGRTSGRDEPLIFPPVLERYDVRDDHHGDPIDASASHTADRAEDVQLDRRLCEATQEVAEREEEDCYLEHLLAAKDV